jgi:hypothetical protein
MVPGIILIFTILDLWIANEYGKKRRIGVYWSFFFCFFFSPLIGFIITQSTPKLNDEYIIKKDSSIYKVLLIVYLIVSLVFFYGFFNRIFGDLNFAITNFLSELLYSLSFGIGFMGAFEYLRSRYNSKSSL